MKIRFLLIVLVLISALAFAGSPVWAQSAQEPAGFKNVTMWLYPEYDDPRLLVMLEGQISGVTPPVPVRFLVPHTAEMYSAGSIDAQGKYSGGPPNRITSQIPGWDEISYQLKSDTFRVEYYDDAIRGNPDKTISFDYRWLYPVADLKVVVQQPLAASSFVTPPEGTRTKEGNFNVTTYNYSNLDISQPTHLDVSYTKTDTAPSVGNTPGASNSSGAGSFNPVSIVIPIVLVIAVAGFILTSRLKRRRPAVVRKTQYSRRTESRPSNAISGFCDQCGKPLGKGNKFCPECGNNLDKPA